MKTLRNKVFFALQTSRIETSSRKNNNIENNKSFDDNNSVSIRKIGGTKNLISRSDFLTSGAKIAFAELRKIFIKASILHHFI